MEFKVIFVTLAVCLGLLGWIYWDLRTMEVYYNWHDYLVDEKSGIKTLPRQLVDMGKVINITDAYVNRTNAMDRLYDQVFQTHLESLVTWHQVYSSERALKLSGWPVSNQTRCGQQLEWINERLTKHQDYQLVPGQLGRELTSLMDSFGKFEAGTYAGLTFWTGSYSLCQRVSLNGSAIKTRYCVAKMRPKWWPEREQVYPKSRLRIGACLPETCDTLSFAQHKSKIEFLVKFDQLDFFKTNLHFDGLHCLPDERSPIRRIPLGGQVLLLLVVAWLSAILVASLLQWLVERRTKRAAAAATVAASGDLDSTQLAPDKTKPQLHKLLDNRTTVVEIGAPERNSLCHDEKPVAEQQQRQQHKCMDLVELLSFQQTWRRFKRDEQAASIERELRAGRPVRVDMRSMNMVKSLMTLSIVWGHSALMVPLLTRLIAHRLELDVGPTARFFMSFSLFVDTFFMLFGLLLAYSLHKKFAGPERLVSPLVWLAVNTSIFLRVAPLFMLTYWFVRLILPYLGAGPWWDYGTYKYSMRGFCMNEPWYKSIPYLGQTDEPHAVGCNGPAWFLVSYTQLALIMPLIVFLLYKLPNQACRLLLLVYLLAMSPLQLALKFSKQAVLGEHVDWSQYGALLATLLEKFQPTGTMSSVGRVGSVAIGCYVGHLLRLYELGTISAWPRWLVSGATLRLTACLQLLVFLLPPLNHWLTRNSGIKTGPVEFITIYVAMSTIWLGLLAIQLINWFTVRNQSRLVRFASGRFWHVFNKLGFCIYLIHWELMLFASTHYEHGLSHGFHTDFWKLCGFGLLFGLPISLALHLLFEAPMAQLLRRLAGV